jgi:hypothetical protein
MSDDHNKPPSRIDFDDLNNELAGAGHAKAARFFDENGRPRSDREKARKRGIKRILSELELLMLDPAYQAAFQAANDAIDGAQAALDAALLENARYIADLEDRAVKLDDGRAVFIRPDGRGETANGEIIPIEIMLTLDIPPDAPTIEEYRAARARQRRLAEHGEDIDKAREEVSDPDNPASKERLDDIRKEMEEIECQVNGTPTLRSSFNASPGPDEIRANLDLTAAPTLKV